jgi:post-segregation antitoxin (ccd killing protein)
MKTFYKPFLNFVVEGDYTSVGFGKMAATYGAMTNTIGTAGRAAMAAYKYERGLLTGDYSKFMENHNIIPQRFKGVIPTGAVIRLFPNILQLQDEFFAQLNYRGFVEGKAVGNALAKHQAELKSGKRKKALKGKKLEEYVQKEVDKVILKAYDQLDASKIKHDLLEQAKARGMNAVQAKKFVAKEFKKNQDLFKRGVNREGRSYTEDLLFKR